MQLKTIYSFILLLFLTFDIGLSQETPLSTKSKRAAKYYTDATKYYDSRQGDNAVMMLKKAIKEDSAFIEAQSLLGNVYEDIGNHEGAITQYRKVIALNPRFNPPYIYLALAKLEIGQAEYEDAKIHAEAFLEIGKGDKDNFWRAKQIVNSCEFAIPAIKHPVPFNPRNMGPSVNSQYDEYFPTMTLDGGMLLFTRKLNMNPNNPNSEDYNEDFYICYKKDGQWTKAVNAGQPLNTDLNEGCATVSADGNMIIFTGCDRPQGLGSCDLYYSFWGGDNWSMARNLGRPVNSGNWETQPSLSADGKSLYFIRGIETGRNVQNMDIYESMLNDSGNWSKPVRLSDTINTPGMQESPFISADNNTLYFCSNGHPGFGGEDIYMSRRLPNGRWGIPRNLGYPINTSKDETGVMIDPNGKLAYFSSNREGGLGGMDIYSFPLYDSIEPEQVTYFKGKIYNAITSKPLIAIFDLIDLSTGKVVTHSTSKPGVGTFILCLPINKNYALNVHKKGYLFYSDNFSLKDISATYDHPYLKDIPLQPIDTGTHIVLKNIFFETNKFELKSESEVELNKLVSFLTNNPSLKIQICGYTDNVKTSMGNQALSENRAKSVYDYLIAHSITDTRLSYVGYGEAFPVATNDTPEGRAQNRRTEIKITGK